MQIKYYEMTKKFDKLYKEMMSVDVLGANSAEPYNTSDVRTPKVLGMRKRLNFKKKKSK